MKIEESLNKIKTTKEKKIMATKEEKTINKYTTGEAQKQTDQNRQEEVTVKDDTPETSVTTVSEDNLKSETVKQSKEVEKAGLDISTNQMSIHDKSQAINGQNVESPFEKEREAFIKRLKENGIDTTTFEKGYIDIVKAIDSDKQLRLKAIKPRKDLMKYQLIEILEDGSSDELENNKTILKSSDVELGTSKVDDILMGMQGYYGDVQQKIKIYMSQIAKYRLLKPVVADSDVLNGEQIIKELKIWFESHMSDSRVASFVIDDFYHVALVKRGERTPYKIFYEVMQEIAPANKTSAIKDWLYENNMLVHDSNSACMDTQKTLSAPIIEQINSKGDKCISFNFEEEYRKKYYEEYVKNQQIANDSENNKKEEVK